jgi:hypothetical protein
MIDMSEEFLLHTRPTASAPHPLLLLWLEDILTGRRSDSGRAVLAALLP